jgi:hypothetical protein
MADLMQEGYFPYLAPAATVAASLVSAFIGSWFGARAAAARFKQERAFERQLNWYETMIEALHDMAQKIEIARTFIEEPGTEARLLDKVWRDVQEAQLNVERIGNKAALYASAKAVKITRKVVAEMEDIANQTEAFSWQAIKDRGPAKVDLVEGLVGKLTRAAKPLSEEARNHLGVI